MEPLEWVALRALRRIRCYPCKATVASVYSTVPATRYTSVSCQASWGRLFHATGKARRPLSPSSSGLSSPSPPWVWGRLGPTYRSFVFASRNFARPWHTIFCGNDRALRVLLYGDTFFFANPPWRQPCNDTKVLAFSSLALHYHGLSWECYRTPGSTCHVHWPAIRHCHGVS